MVILITATKRPKLYVGSAWGERGIGRRVRDHLSPSHRETEPNKQLYVAWKEPGTTVHILHLVDWTETVSQHLVSIAESIAMVVFGTYKSVRYELFRAGIESGFVLQDPDALNKADPLASERAWSNGSDEKQARTLKSVQEGGSVKVNTKTSKSGIQRFWFSLVDLEFTIPPDYGKRMALKKTGMATVCFDITTKKNPNAYVTNAPENSAGARLGIRIIAIGPNDEERIWLKRGGSSLTGLHIANALVDFAEGLIPDPDSHDWPADRHAFVGANSVHNVARRARNTHKPTEAETETSKRRERASANSEGEGQKGGNAAKGDDGSEKRKLTQTTLEGFLPAKRPKFLATTNGKYDGTID